MKFSFVVVGYNQKDLIRNAIDSIVNQTYRDLEVIYVDDCSTDGCAELVEQVYASDERVRVLHLAENKGLYTARMEGMKMITGDWVLFADGDDAYSVDACAVLAKTISSHPDVNMIGFGAGLTYEGDTKHIDKNSLEVFFHAPEGYFSQNQILEVLFLKNRRAWNVWNKCYSAELVRRVLGNMSPSALYYAEDYYLSFVLCHQADGYFGIPDRLYQYSIGIGISTAKRLSLTAFERAMTAAQSMGLTADYAGKQGLYEKYKRVFHGQTLELIRNFCEKLHFFQGEEKILAAKLLFDSFGVRDVISCLAYAYRQDPVKIAEQLDVSKLFPYTRKPVKTVGMLYNKLYDGGLERVMSLLTPILQRAGYRVVIVTNDPVDARDYPLPEGTVRVSLGQLNHDADMDNGYGLRYDALTRCIREHHIDVMIHHAWHADELFWDLCTIKSTGAACIIHSHNVFFVGVNYGWLNSIRSGPVFRHADAMVVLSDVDRCYWAGCNANIHRVNNPLTFDPGQVTQSGQDNHNVVWAGRFDPWQKNPCDILYIFSEVIRSVPDARLYLVGTGEAEVLANMHAVCKELRLEDHVTFTGYTKDVGAYLQNAAVYLFPTNFEGYSMAFAEALSYGLPIVTYPLPYMTMAKNSGATVQVGWKDIHGAAEAVIDLLSDDERRRALGNMAREEALAYAQEDLSVTWQQIFESLKQEDATQNFTADVPMLDTYQKTVNLAFSQMSYYHGIPGAANGGTYRGILHLDYGNMSRPKRWLTYLIYDRGRLKTIVKKKCRNRPLLLKIGRYVWKVLKFLRRMIVRA